MKKKLLVVASILLTVIIAVGGIIYWNYTGTPEYSLSQVEKAIEQRDLTSFQKYVDIEGVVNSLVDQVIEFTSAQYENEAKDEWEQMGVELGKKLVKILKPTLVEILKQQILMYIQTGKINNDESKGNISTLKLWDKINREKSALRGISYVKKEGKNAYVGLELFQEKYDTSLTLSLKMINKGGYWQIVEIVDLLEFLKKLDELETQRIAKLNKPIIEAMKQTLILEKIQKYTSTEDFWGLNKQVIFKLRFRNAGQKEIDEYQIILTCKTLNGQTIKVLSATINDNIAPGQTADCVLSMDVNMFIESDNVLYETPQSDLKIDVDTGYIKFADGSELKLYKKEPIL